MLEIPSKIEPLSNVIKLPGGKDVTNIFLHLLNPKAGYKDDEDGNSKLVFGEPEDELYKLAEKLAIQISETKLPVMNTNSDINDVKAALSMKETAEKEVSFRKAIVDEINSWGNLISQLNMEIGEHDLFKND